MTVNRGVIAGRCDEAISTTKRYCEEEQSNNPYPEALLRGGTMKQSPCSTKLLIGFNPGIASSRHSGFDNSNIVLAGFAMTVN